MKFVRIIKNFLFKEVNINKDIEKMMKYEKLLSKYKKNNFIKRIIIFLLYYHHDKIFLKYSCDITPSCKLGNVIFRHPLGIVIGGGAIINDGVIIHQNVTFGALKFDKTERRGIPCK